MEQESFQSTQMLTELCGEMNNCLRDIIRVMQETVAQYTN